VLGIDSAENSELNGNMQKMVLIMWAVALCGCPGGRGSVRLPQAIVRESSETAPPISPGPTRSPEAAPAKPDISSEEAKPDRSPEIAVPRRDRAPHISDVNRELQDAFFEYDRAELRTDALAALQRDTGLLFPILGEFPELTIVIEGHCDERGSAEYNLGLGAHRSARAVDVLRGFGIPAERMEQVSYGKERPQCTDSAEFCWQRNRRVHLLLRPLAGR
jgi:peptidoglycan-associated lipoprotein